MAKILFLSLGALLYLYASSQGIVIPDRTDQLYPTIALQYLPAIVGLFFILGLIAAAYSSADSALTSLTTSFCIDFLNFEKSEKEENSKKRTRLIVHVGFSLILLLVIIIFNAMNNEAVINGLLKAAGYTYGPILGLFAFGILTQRKITDKWVVPIALAAPVITYVIDSNSEAWLGGFQFGILNLALNGFLTFVGLMVLSFSIQKHNPLNSTSDR